jgi:hypothetical protein
MAESTDFSFEGDQVPSPEIQPAEAPVFVIEYRQRGLASRLMPPALILLAAIAISSYQRKTPVRPLLPRPEPAANLAPHPEGPAAEGADRRPLVLAEKSQEAVAQPQQAKGQDARSGNSLPAPGTGSVKTTEPTTVAARGSETAREPSPFELTPVEGLHPLETPPVSPALEPAPAAVVSRDRDPRPTSDDLPATEPAIRPAPEGNSMPPQEAAAGPSRDDILRDIEREAEQRDAQREDLEGLKTRARSLMLTEALARVQASRALFRTELQQLLAELGDHAGPEIESLAVQYGKEPLPEVKNAYIRILRTAPKRMTRQARVELMRVVGVPEPLILDQICHEFDKVMNTRGGPRSEDEVRVRAARALLAIPLRPARKPSTASGEPQPSPGPDAHASSRPAPGPGPRP